MRLDQKRAQYVPLKITCKKEGIGALSKTTLFQLSQIAQHKTVIPVQMISFNLTSVSPNQWEGICLKLEGGTISNETAIMRHTNLASGQVKKKCCMLSPRLQKIHLTLPFQLFLAIFSFVNVTPI